MIRLFAGLALPVAVRARLAQVQQGLGGRLVAPENLHVTLAFFGELPQTRAADLHAALLAVRAPGFTFWLDGVGAFGRARPRSLHAVVRPEPGLSHLHDKVEQAARGAGIAQDDARYTPHVTLSRYRPGALDAATAAKLMSARAAFLAGPLTALAFHLYRAELGHAGASYAVVSTYDLSDPGSPTPESRPQPHPPAGRR